MIKSIKGNLMYVQFNIIIVMFDIIQTASFHSVYSKCKTKWQRLNYDVPASKGQVAVFDCGAEGPVSHHTSYN